MGENSIPDIITNSVISESVKEIIKELFKEIKTYIPKSKSTDPKSSIANEPDTQIAHLLIEMYNWCSNIEFIGYADPIQMSTIDLKYYFSYRDENPLADVKNAIIEESEIIYANKHIILEGDPGSGKTTTLKRILLTTFFNNEKNDYFGFPLLVRLRLVETSYNFFSYFCYLLGIETELKVEESIRKVSKKRRIDLSNDEKDFLEEEYFVDEKVHLQYQVVKGKRINQFVIDFIEENKALILIDGLDELHPSILPEFTQNIKEIIIKTNSAKVILTTRPDYITSLENCVKLRIRDLNSDQQLSIAKKWTDHPELFINELSNRSYKDLANKPLFFNFLILLYKESQSSNSIGLPIESIDVYSQIIELIIDKWDHNREIRIRKSKYYHFHNKKKEKFLSALAFFLTYQIKQKAFSTEDLEKAYRHIYENFQLPSEEAILVAKEIQSHTGLIIKTSFNKFEFSHLTLQEFLCAKYIIITASLENILLYLFQYPAPLALCVGLSGDSSHWLNIWILTPLINSDNPNKSAAFSSLLSRLNTEKLHFSYNLKLAGKLLEIVGKLDFSNKSLKDNYHNFIKNNKNIEEAIRHVLVKYKISNDGLYIWNLLKFTLIEKQQDFLPLKIMLPNDSYLLSFIPMEDTM